MKYAIAAGVMLLILTGTPGWAAEPLADDPGVYLYAPPNLQPVYGSADPEPAAGGVHVSCGDCVPSDTCHTGSCVPACCHCGHCRDCVSCVDRHARAGNPQTVAPWAKCSYSPKYTGYYVGGGVTPGHFSRGEGRYPDEGTWGVDYDPWYSHVRLLWSHGRLYQGGTGQYEPDEHNIPLDQRYGRRVSGR